MEAIAQRILEEARTYLGVPWKHKGRDRSGLDCAGLIWCVGMGLGLLPIYYHYPLQYTETVTTPLLLYTLSQVCKFRPILEIKPGDILVFSTGDFPGHSGFYAGDTFIHATCMGTRCVTEHTLSSHWKSRILAAYTFRGTHGT